MDKDTDMQCGSRHNEMYTIVTMRPGILMLIITCFLPSSLSAQPHYANQKIQDHELAQRILSDKRMDRVIRMGHELLKTGMNAGSGYSEVWIRDLNTFIVPLLDVSSHEAVREALLAFFHFQGKDGNIIDGYVPASKAHVNYKYRSSKTRPNLKAHKNTVETDQESSLAQAVCRYLRKTKDSAFLDEVVQGISVRQRLEMALEYPLKHRFSERYQLIWGATTADWGDVQPEHTWGVELDASSHRAIDIYDNALFLVALGEYLETVCETDALKTKWKGHQRRLQHAVREHLWDAVAQKFRAHIYLEGSPFPKDFDESKVYYHGGTAVAIEAGLLTPNEILSSYGQMRANMRLSGAATLGLTLYPLYPKGSFKNKAMGPYSYQNGGDWTWFGGRMVRQLARHGYTAEAYRELVPMLERVIRHQGFHEWWSIDNQPRGSGSFRGSAGVLIEAIDELRQWATNRS